MSILDKLSQKILKLILPATALFIPLAFLPLTTDLFNPTKQILIVFLAGLSLLAFAVKLIAHKRLQFTISPSLLPLLALIAVYLISAFFQTPTRYLGLTGNTTTIIALSIIFITTTSSINDRNVITKTLMAAIISTTIVSIWTILQFAKIPQALTSLGFLASETFNPTGGPLPLLTLTLPLLPLSLISALKSNSPITKVFFFVTAIINTIASIVAISLLLPQAGNPRLIVLPLSAGWNIAVETFKNARTALLGVGPNNFLAAFNQFKPLSFNNSSLWTIRFSNSSNQYLHLLTTVGVLGLLFYLLAFIRPLYIYHKSSSHSSESLTLKIAYALLLLIALFIPTNIVFLTYTFIFLSLLTIDLKTQKQTIKDVILSIFALTTIESQPLHEVQTTKQNSSILAYLFLLLSLILISFAGFYQTKAYAADLTFFRSLQAAAQNKGTDTYNLQIRAINLNPLDPRFHLAYSQTNLALANSIASQGNLSDQDRANITQLIQQAIREAKSATTLAPQDASTWSNLANIYRQLLNLAQGADQWSVAAYSQAIALNPLDPQLRLDLGSLQYSLGNYDQAIARFQEAISAKPDWANAYYNLAAAYKENKQYDLAYQALQAVVSLIEPNSDDYQKVQDELGQLQQYVQTDQAATPSAQLEATTPTDQTLTNPTPLPSPSIEPIQLPDESGLNLNNSPEATQSPTPAQ